MSYKALYRTYRPKQFNDVVGQEHIIQTLKNIIELDKISHAYLFAGPRGTGKTSVAHILAKNLNCKDIQNKTMNCGNCETCLDKNSMDIIEIDAASNNGVAEVRSIIQNSKYAPSISKYKIYIIDEVHMLSKGAFNALLKTLEEPPAHVIFILATTEPEKIPVTILSRTQRFNFKRIGNEDIVKRLKVVLKNEKIIFEDKALVLIANLAKGGMRDALSIADQASSYSKSGLILEEISKVFGVLSEDKIIMLLNNIFNKKTREVLMQFQEILNNGYEIKLLVETIVNLLKDFIIFKKTNDISLITSTEKETLDNISFQTLFAFDLLEIFVKVSSDLRFSETPNQVFELALLQSVFFDQNIQENSNKISKEIKKPKKTEDDFFETQNIVSKEIKVEENKESDKSIQEKIEKTMELSLNQESIQEDEEANEIEEEILSQNSFKDTDELKISDIFSTDDTTEIEKEYPKSQFSIEEVINLLVQANKSIHILNKERWAMKDKLALPQDRQLINLLEKTNLISSANNFLLLESEDISVIKEINRLRKNEQTIRFVKKIIDHNALIFAITKEEFEKTKQKWIELSKNDNLPKPQPIENIKIQEAENNAEKFGESLFGEIFKS